MWQKPSQYCKVIILQLKIKLNANLTENEECLNERIDRLDIAERI